MTVVSSQPPAPPDGGPGKRLPDGGLPDHAHPTFRGRVRGGMDLLRQQFRGTPGRLRAVAALGVLAGILLGLSAGQAFRVSAHALEAADVNATQVIRVQQLTIDLVSADAAVTNAFLLGGEEPPEQREAYTSGMAAASAALAQAARVQPADADALGALNQAVLAYAGQIEQARANNRQGTPLGAGYLRAASSTLRDDALPVLDALVAANQGRVETELGNAQWAMAWVVVGGVLCLGILVGLSVWLARRTHRYLNMPVVLAGAIGLAVLLVGGLMIFSAGRTASEVRDGPYAAALAASTARVDAFDAKANESLTLIARGSGGAFETAWQDKAASVEQNLASPALAANVEAKSTDDWNAYAAVHADIRKLDDAGRWDEAVGLATGLPPANSTVTAPKVNANTTFAAFDQASAAQLSEAGQETTSRLTSSLGWLRFLGWLAILAGLIAALAAWWGVAARLEEYR